MDEFLSGIMKDLEKVESFINYEKRQTNAQSREIYSWL